MKGLFFVDENDNGFEIVSEVFVRCNHMGIDAACIVAKNLGNHQVKVVDIANIDTVETEKVRIGY